MRSGRMDRIVRAAGAVASMHLLAAPAVLTFSGGWSPAWAQPAGEASADDVILFR